MIMSDYEAGQRAAYQHIEAYVIGRQRGGFDENESKYETIDGVREMCARAINVLDRHTKERARVRRTLRKESKR